jgi:hypothetical protein
LDSIVAASESRLASFVRVCLGDVMSELRASSSSDGGG